MKTKFSVQHLSLGAALMALLLAGGVSQTHAQPTQPSVTEVFPVEGGSLSQGSKLRIHGDGFGSKEIAPPVLLDLADHAYEYGEVNNIHSSVGGDGAIPLGRENNNDAIWATSTSTFLLKKDGDKRHKYSDAAYYLDGENAWVGGPVAYGGPTGWDTPVDNPQLYVSWWYKNKYNSTYYWRFSANKQSGSFVPGEKIIVGGNTGSNQGYYVGVDDDGLLNAVIYEHRNKTNLIGKTITGVSSGASTVFPDQFRGGSGYGYETPGSKLARIWDDPDGKAGIRSSVALHDAYVNPSRSGYTRAIMYYSLELPENEWVHIEYELDTTRGLLRVFEDGRLLGEEYFSREAIYSGAYSPTLALLGTNAKQLMLQESWISEVYVDNTLQRVVVGNAPKYADVTHSELQLPIQWNDDQIDFSLRLGGLDVGGGLYLYVFDKEGVSNSVGFPLCDGNDCPAPPSKIPLIVE